MKNLCSITILITAAINILPDSGAAAEPRRGVRFDLPPVAAAVPPSGDDSMVDPGDPTLVSVTLRLSAMIESADVPTIDQWMVRCLPRDPALTMVDYSPRTETTSDVTGSIQVKTTEEDSQAIGLSLDGTYGHFARANAGADNASKQINTIQYDRRAPEKIVVAAGTIHRGRGVYFKLRSDGQQILEGEKVFQLTFRVPPAWRGSLLDVSVVAQAETRSIAPWDRQTKTISSDHFVVAVYRQGDHQAKSHAQALADAEYALRETARRRRSGEERGSISAVLRQVAISLDLDANQADRDWLDRLLANRADPHLDKQIRKLPMDVRVAVLDYAERRDDFFLLSQGNGTSLVAAETAK